MESTPIESTPIESVEVPEELEQSEHVEVSSATSQSIPIEHTNRYGYYEINTTHPCDIRNRDVYDSITPLWNMRYELPPYVNSLTMAVSILTIEMRQMKDTIHGLQFINSELMNKISELTEKNNTKTSL